MKSFKIILITAFFGSILFSCSPPDDDDDIIRPISFTVDKIVFTKTPIYDNLPSDYDRYVFYAQILLGNGGIIEGDPILTEQVFDFKNTGIYNESTGILGELEFTLPQENRLITSDSFVLEAVAEYSSGSSFSGLLQKGINFDFSLDNIYTNDNATTTDIDFISNGFEGSVSVTFQY